MDEFGKNGEQAYAALIGDVVASRKIGNRADFQQRLLSLIQELNVELETLYLAAPLTISAGDEVQGLFLRPKAIVYVVTRMEEELAPARLVYGTGFGMLTTNLTNNTLHLDGPCFHRARSALELAKSEDRWLVARGYGGATDATLTALYDLMAAIRRRWTERQLVYARAIRGHPPSPAARRPIASHGVEAQEVVPQAVVANDMDVARSTVSESLKASSFRAILEGERAARTILHQFGAKTEPPTSSANMPNNTHGEGGGHAG